MSLKTIMSDDHAATGAVIHQSGVPVDMAQCAARVLKVPVKIIEKSHFAPTRDAVILLSAKMGIPLTQSN